jgi:hypothetical protein
MIYKISGNAKKRNIGLRIVGVTTVLISNQNLFMAL